MYVQFQFVVTSCQGSKSLNWHASVLPYGIISFVKREISCPMLAESGIKPANRIPDSGITTMDSTAAGRFFVIFAKLNGM